MPFKKNDPNINRDGRPRGASTQEASILRNDLINFLRELFEHVKKDYLSDKVNTNGRARAKLFSELLCYALPKLQNTEFRGVVDLLSDEQAIELRNYLESKINNDDTDNR